MTGPPLPVNFARKNNVCQRCVRLAWRALLTAMLLFVLGSGNYALARKQKAAVFGSVCDASGCVVTNARIWLTNSSTGFRHESTTDKDGHFVLLNLDPGIYSLRAQSSGFAVVEITGLALKAKSSRGLRMRLKANATAAPSGQQSCGNACRLPSREKE